MKFISMFVDLREVIGLSLVDENEDKVYTILGASWNDKQSVPTLELEEREVEK
jgi:hypothetical protein